MNNKKISAVLILGAIAIGAIVFYFGGGITQKAEGRLILRNPETKYFEIHTENDRIFGFATEEGTIFKVEADWDSEIRGLKDLYFDEFTVSVEYGIPRLASRFRQRVRCRGMVSGDEDHGDRCEGNPRRKTGDLSLSRA